MQALGDFCKRYLGDSAVVVRGYVNRVSKPKTKSYVLVTPMTMTRLSTNLHQTECGGEAIVQPQRRRVQLDVYGPTAADRAQTLATLLRDGVGCRFLQTYGIAPLYVEDPQDMTQAEGDEQYNPRFMLNVLVQANRVEHVEMDTFIRTGVTLSNTQKVQLLAEIGLDVSQTLETQGWYMQVKDPGATVRGQRQSPECKFYYMDGGSLQQIVMPATAIQ